MFADLSRGHPGFTPHRTDLRRHDGSVRRGYIAGLATPVASSARSSAQLAVGYAPKQPRTSDDDSDTAWLLLGSLAMRAPAWRCLRRMVQGKNVL
jgi:hypothetical protein